MKKLRFFFDFDKEYDISNRCPLKQIKLVLVKSHDIKLLTYVHLIKKKK